eukprot:1109138-Prorocentrum_minimum.AAC.3
MVTGAIIRQNPVPPLHTVQLDSQSVVGAEAPGRLHLSLHQTKTKAERLSFASQVDATDDKRTYGELTGLFIEYLNLTEYAAVLTMAAEAGSTSELFAHGQQVTAKATLDLQEYAMPEQYEAGPFVLGLRFWDDQGWSKAGVTIWGTTLKAEVANIQVRFPYER